MEPFKLGNWHVSPKLNQLTLVSSGKEETVTPKTMQLLVALVKQGDDPASVEQLISKVWQDRVVADSSVYQAVAQLRKVLSQDEKHETYIERISGQGYRIASDILITSADTTSSSRPLKRIMLLATMAIFAVIWLVYATQSKTHSQSRFFESLSLAGYLIKQRNPEQLEHAKQLYLTVLKEDKNNIEALNGLCDSYRLLTVYGTLPEIERDSLCQPLLENAYSIAPTNTDVLASIARQLFEQGDIAKSEAMYNQALAITKQNSNLWHGYGQLKRSQNDISEALIAHQKAFKLEPNNPVILRGLAYAYLNNRDLPNARKYFERSIVITPNFKNKPLYELDFYPLNQQRAGSYLAWYQQYSENYLKKYPLHRLSYVIFLLSLNQGELAVQELNSVANIKNIPKQFLFYVKAAVAWHLKQPEIALSYLQQRYLLAEEENHFVMPYIFALINLDKKEKALALFNKHFTDIVEIEHLNKTQLSQYLLLTSLYKSLNKKQAYQRAYSKVLSLRQEVTIFPEHDELTWLVLIEDTTGAFDILSRMLQQGWLPDYNDSMFTYSYYQQLIDDDNDRNTWLELLNEQQRCIWNHQRCQRVNIQAY